MVHGSRFRDELATAVNPRPVRELMTAGVTRGTLAGPTWRQVSRGFYVPASAERSPTQRILDVLPLLRPESAVGGWAAAFMQGTDDLDGIDPTSFDQLPVLVCLGSRVGRRRTPGVRYSWERLPPADVVRRAAIPCTTPERTCFDGARLAPDLREAVAFVDLTMRATGLDPVDLASYLDLAGSGWSGTAQARRTLTLADPASRSGWESRLRVWYVVEASFPPPRVNVPVFDLEGQLLGYPDLLDEEAGTVLEFDGSLHRVRERHRRDNVREEGFEDVNLQVVRADSLDLLRHEPLLRMRVTRARQRGWPGIAAAIAGPRSRRTGGGLRGSRWLRSCSRTPTRPRSSAAGRSEQRGSRAVACYLRSRAVCRSSGGWILRTARNPGKCRARVRHGQGASARLTSMGQETSPTSAGVTSRSCRGKIRTV